MGPLVKIVAASALLLGAVDGHAKANNNCIRMLEVRPAPQVGSVRPCPMAIRFDPHPDGPSVTSRAHVASRPLPFAEAARPETRSSLPTDRARPV